MSTPVTKLKFGATAYALCPTTTVLHSTRVRRVGTSIAIYYGQSRIKINHSLYALFERVQEMFFILSRKNLLLIIISIFPQLLRIVESAAAAAAAADSNLAALLDIVVNLIL